MIFFAGSSDRLFVEMNIDYESQIYVYRALVFVVPLVAGWIAKRWCEELLRHEAHPLRGPGGGRVRRTPSGGFEPDYALTGAEKAATAPSPTKTEPET
jgi:hypothetical protein